jgi:hypothetical protein
LLVALFLAVGVAGIGFKAFFSDLGPHEALWVRILVVGAAYTVVPLLVGALIPDRWYLAVLAAVGPVALGAFAMVMRIAGGVAPPYWSFITVSLVGVPAVACCRAMSGRE